VLREMAACLTAGDMLRFYALHSDDWLQRPLGIVDGMAILTTSIPPLDDADRARYLERVAQPVSEAVMAGYRSVRSPGCSGGPPWHPLRAPS
jgi:hypothetical protein